MLMYLNIVGSCNFKCPTCPMGKSVSINKTKAMTSELFSKILKKQRMKAFLQFIYITRQNH